MSDFQSMKSEKMTRLKWNNWTRYCSERRNCKLLATTVDRCQLLATLIPTSARQIIPQQVGRYFQQFVPRSLSNHVFTFHILILMKLFNSFKRSDWIYSSRFNIGVRCAVETWWARWLCIDHFCCCFCVVPRQILRRERSEFSEIWRKN